MSVVSQRLFRALFVLPFSAGDPKSINVNGLVSHDGSISGVVFLACIVVILCEILVIGAFTTNQEESTELFVLTMELTSGLAILICIILIIYAKLKPSIVQLNEHWDISSKIMMQFYWLFTLACLGYSAIYIAYHVDCLKNNYPVDNVKNRILCDVMLFTYRLVQTGFLTHFSQRVFVSQLRFYYSLLALFLINIAVIVIDVVQSMRDVNDFTINATTIKKNTCASNSTIYPFLNNASNFLEPAGLEYSLLTILFITELWPKKACQLIKTKRFFIEYDNIGNDEETHLINDLPQNEPIYDNMPLLNSAENPRTRTLTFVIVILGVLVSIPTTVLFILKIYTTKNYTVDKALNICSSVQMTVVMIVLVKCFYLLQTNCKPIKEESHFNSKDYLIFVSFIGSLAYFTMRLIPYIVLIHTDTQNVNKTYNYIIMILGTYYQTVFLFQMKNYGKSEKQSSQKLIEFTCMFLAITNFLIWAEDSFLAGQWVFLDDAPTIFYGKMVWVTYFTLLYSFVIFYRFKCFVAFYGLYHRFSVGINKNK